MTAPWQDFVAQARDLHRRVLVVDTHCDTTQRLMDPAWDFLARHDDGHIDLPRLREGGIDAIFLAIWCAGPLAPGEALPIVRRQFHRIHALVDAHAGDLVFATCSGHVEEAHAAGKIAILVGVEGGYLMDDSLDALRGFAGSGAAYMTLTHAFHTNWCDSSGVHEALSPIHGGLTPFGRDVIREMNKLGIMVDVSHASAAAVSDAIETSCAPVIASHSSCTGVAGHIRNLDDDQIRSIAATGGVVQVNFAASFIDPGFPPIDKEVLNRWMQSEGLQGGPLCDHITPLSILADHVDHAVQLVGAEHVGLGSDFDGVPQLPESLGDCAQLPNLTAELLRRGYSEHSLELILGRNVLRVMDACRQVAEKLQGKSGPVHDSDASVGSVGAVDSLDSVDSADSVDSVDAAAG